MDAIFGFSMSKNPRVPILPIFEICRFFAEKFAGDVNCNSAAFFDYALVYLKVEVYLDRLLASGDLST